jgi:hypothetical protein
MAVTSLKNTIRVILLTHLLPAVPLVADLPTQLFFKEQSYFAA